MPYMIITSAFRSLLRASLLLALLCSGAMTAGADMPMGRDQLFQLGTLAAREEKYDEALMLFKKVLEVDPKFSPAYNTIGLVYQAMSNGEQNAEALRYFRMAVDIAPDYVECWNNLARSAYAQGQFVSAEKAGLQSLSLRPDQPDMEIVLGWVYLIGESRAEEAVAHFEAGLLKREDAMAHYGLGLANVLLEDKFKVLDQITELRHYGKEDLAKKLEEMVRTNAKISSRPGSPLITGDALEASLFDKELQTLSHHGFNAGDPSQGIKVRLKGPLLN